MTLTKAAILVVAATVLGVLAIYVVEPAMYQGVMDAVDAMFESRG